LKIPFAISTRTVPGAARLAAAAAAVGLLGLNGAARPAHAQDVVTPPRARPFAIKVGAFFPADRDARRASDPIVFAIEGQYTLGEQLLTNELAAQTVITAGYAGRGDFSIAPFTLGMILRNPNQPVDRGFYYGGGLGLYVTKLETRTEDLDPNDPGTSGRTKNLGGGYVMAGLNFGGAFAEAKYHFINTYDTKRADGLQITAGVRF
jgi:hypothetical protein